MIKKNYNSGMTYVELIVVLSIFAVISSVVMFNYGSFQDKVDIKNLASDIALQVVQAQKSSVSGLLPTLTPTVSPWKPSYGVYFNISAPKQFVYFADLNNQNGYENGEAITTINITKNNSLSKIEVSGAGCPGVTNLGIVFKRPDSGAVFTSNNLAISCAISYAQITVSSPKGMTALIKIYPSGRVQVN